MNERRLPFRPLPWLTFLWAVYYICVFTFGRYEDLTRQVIWIGGAVAGAATLFACRRWRFIIPREAWWLIAFVLWTLPGGMLNVSMRDFIYFERLLIQFIVIVVLLSMALRRGGGMNWLYGSFIATAAFHILIMPDFSTMDLVRGMSAETRRAALGGGENTLGWYGFMGALGAVVLLGTRMSVWLKAAAAAGGLLSLYAIMVSASRGAFISFALCVVIWPVLCAGARLRRKWLVVVILALVAVGTRYFMQNIYSGSYLSKRIGDTAREQYQENSRLRLLTTAIRIGFEHPIFGVGLGQFGRVSGTMSYTHTEGAELWATTGIVGFGLFMAMYVAAWRRLTRSLRHLRDLQVRYQVNCARMTLIILVISGLLFKPHFLNISSNFLVAMIVGVGLWGDDLARREAQRGAPAAPSLCPEGLPRG
jgi:O-antigen ligase